MKKFTLFTLFIVMLSCLKETTNESEIIADQTSDFDTQDFPVLEAESLTYHFEGKTFEIIENNTQGDRELFDEILELPNLNIYYDGSENVRLFRDNESFKEFEGTLDNVKENSSSKVNYYGYVKIYTDSYYKGAYYRTTSYSQYGTNGPVPIYNYSHPSGGTWNDKTSSLIVYNCYAQFFENAYSNTYNGAITGKILTVDDKNDVNYAIGYKRLKSLRMTTWKSWNDQISEYRIGKVYSR